MAKEKSLKVPIEISARHIHLSQADLNKLFGKQATLKEVYPLSQKGEFASDSFVTLSSKKGDKEINLRVLGPCREKSQIELSLSDAYSLGYKIPLRLSGDLKNTPKLKVRTQDNSIFVPAIIPQRHLHLPQETARQYGLKNKQIVSCIITGSRELILKKIIVRINAWSTPALHLDTDEGNAAGISKKQTGEILK